MIYTFEEALAQPAVRVGEETRDLAGLPGFVIASDLEERFYTSNNLPEQLSALFSGINPRRLDEDALEVACARAQERVRGATLLENDIQLLYRAQANAGLLGVPAYLRRPGRLEAEEFLSRPPGAELLFALKHLWARDWTFDAVLARLDAGTGIGLEAGPVLVLPGRA
ncbi:hypothetical protein HNR42_002905 [Deinobacterium chartae]|uniref:Uncharacterized protein n=1 Tax=Deinobacterium chartae TaxID=521158 RepID=A0A841I6I6_9DEIO|nr:hypothetical protein [Deinobacterium chartae]MBB6099455.1 hypothetical protein [Deinobacterium chartae]